VVSQGLLSKLHDGDVVQNFQLDEANLHLDTDDSQISLLLRSHFLHQDNVVMLFSVGWSYNICNKTLQIHSCSQG
jgi:hypothetical protein